MAGGIALTLAVHVIALVFVSFSGLKYIYPPPPENTFLIDFSKEEEAPSPNRGREPRSAEPDKSRPVELVQKSSSPHQGTAQNLTPATARDDFGDVETPAPEPVEEVLDPRAAFPGMAKKDTSLTAPHSAAEADKDFKAGSATGNVQTGRTDGKANAHLEGRNPIGAGLRKPTYNSQESGRVIVKIWVDQYGIVRKAEAGADGTTVTDKNLWAAARKAALETRFNQKADAPAMQEGTITYIFNLK